MKKDRIYVHDINFPTVPTGRERLQIAPTPRHNDEMKRQFVDSTVSVQKDLQLSLVQNHVPEVAFMLKDHSWRPRGTGCQGLKFNFIEFIHTVMNFIG